MGYGIVSLAGHTFSPNVRVKPTLGLRCDFGIVRMLMYGGAESLSYDGRFRDVWGGKMQYQLNNKYAIYAEVSNENAMLFSVGLNSYW